MNALAYALAGCLIILAAPIAQAEPTTPDPPQPPDFGGDCSFFVYQIDPPAYRLDPSCLPPGIGP
jgi:hypothetical protein